MSDYLNPVINPATGNKYPRIRGKSIFRSQPRKGSSSQNNRQQFFNILDLIGVQRKQFKPGQVPSKSTRRNINPNEHRAHGQKLPVATLSPVTDSSGLQFPTMPGFGDVGSFMEQAGQFVNPQYDAAIEAIRAMQAQKTARANTNRGILGDMFGQLGQYFATDAQKASGNVYTQAQQAVTQQGTDARDSIAQTYTDIQAQQRAEAERLGIQDMGLDEVVAEQNRDKAFVDALTAKDTAAVQGNLTSGQQSAQNFNAASGNVARLEGSERQAGLMRQLEDYLSQSNTEIGGLEGQRANALAQMAMQLAQQDYQNRQAQYGSEVDRYRAQREDEDRMWSREMQLMELEAAMGAAAQGQRGEGPDDPWSQVAEFAERVQPGYGKNIMAVLMQNMQDDELQNLLSNRARPVTPASFARYFNSQNRRGTGADSAALNQTAQLLYTLLYGKG